MLAAIQLTSERYFVPQQHFTSHRLCKAVDFPFYFGPQVLHSGELGIESGSLLSTTSLANPFTKSRYQATNTQARPTAQPRRHTTVFCTDFSHRFQAWNLPRRGWCFYAMQQRRDEILAKKAKLAELKRQRELRQSQATAGRQSTGSPSDVSAPIASAELDSVLTLTVGS